MTVDFFTALPSNGFIFFSPAMTNRLSFSSYASSASMEGLLEKHGGVGNFLVKKYWCVLDEGKLSYFKDPNKVNEIFVTSVSLEMLIFLCDFHFVGSTQTLWDKRKQ